MPVYGCGCVVVGGVLVSRSRDCRAEHDEFVDRTAHGSLEGKPGRPITEDTAERQGALEAAIIRAIRDNRRGLTMPEQATGIERALRGLGFQSRVMG